MTWCRSLLWSPAALLQRLEHFLLVPPEGAESPAGAFHESGSGCATSYKGFLSRPVELF